MLQTNVIKRILVALLVSLNMFFSADTFAQSQSFSPGDQLDKASGYGQCTSGCEIQWALIYKGVEVNNVAIELIVERKNDQDGINGIARKTYLFALNEKKQTFLNLLEEQELYLLTVVDRENRITLQKTPIDRGLCGLHPRNLRGAFQDGNVYQQFNPFMITDVKSEGKNLSQVSPGDWVDKSSGRFRCQDCGKAHWTLIYKGVEAGNVVLELTAERKGDQHGRDGVGKETFEFLLHNNAYTFLNLLDEKEFYSGTIDSDKRMTLQKLEIDETACAYESIYFRLQLNDPKDFQPSVDSDADKLLSSPKSDFNLGD